jgi:hypothetical protein
MPTVQFVNSNERLVGWDHSTIAREGVRGRVAVNDGDERGAGGF